MQLARVVRAPLHVVAAVALGLLTAVPAAAHTPTLKSGCVDGNAVLTVGLTRYDGSRSNSVAVEDNGRSVEDSGFRESFRRSYSEPGTVEHAFTVTVRAWDDSEWDRGWSFSRTLTVPACVTPTTTPLTFDRPTAQRKALVVPAANDSGLPDTDADVTVPLVLAVLLLSGGVVVLFVLRRRLQR